MGQSTNGILMFGVAFDEGFEFPWDVEPFGGDTDDWWASVNGYKGPPSPYDERGDYLPGVEPDSKAIDDFHQHRGDWDDANPLPVEIENVCSGDYPIYALAVPGTVKTARRGYPVPINPGELVADPAALVEFCKRFSIEMPGEPGWILASYWG